MNVISILNLLILLFLVIIFDVNAYNSDIAADSHKPYSYELFVTSGKPLYNRRALGRFPKQAQPIIENIELVRTSCNKGDVSCHLSCVNAEALTGYLFHHVKAKFQSDLTGIENITSDNLNQCLSGSSNPKYSLAEKYLKDLKAHVYSKALDKTLGENKFKKVITGKGIQKSDDSLFFAKFEIAKDAKFDDFAKQKKYDFDSNFTDVVASMATLGNYCALKDRRCIRKATNTTRAGWGFYNTLFSGLHGLENERWAANKILDSTLRVSNDKEYEKKLQPTIYKLIREYPKQDWSTAMQIIDNFAKELLKTNSHEALDTPGRLYCSEDNKANPFIGYSACEYFSAMYYGDYHMVATYDLIFTESVQLNLAYKTLTVDDIWAKMYMASEAKNPKNPKVGSLIQYILVNYMMNYSSYYGQCIKPNAKTYTYNYEKITEMKDRWGFTLNSWSSHSSESFQVNANLVPIYEESPFRMTTKGMEFQALIQTFNTKNEAIKKTEQRYALTHIGSNSILNSLDKFMLKNRCDSNISIRLENKLIEYNELRKQYDAYIDKQPFTSILLSR